MIATTNTTTKQQRGLGSLLNQFGKLGEAMQRSAPAVAEHATNVRQSPVESSFTERLNLMIYSGASFDVAIDDFQTINADRLSEAEKRFLAAGNEEVLCTLQQSLLMKHLPEEKSEAYIFEVRERALIVSDGANLEPPFEVLQSITKRWFQDLLEEMFEGKG